MDHVTPLLRRLNAVALQYAPRGNEGRDLVQETLLRAWRNYSSVEEKTYRGAWLFVIMRNVAFEWQRAGSSRLRLTLLPDTELTELISADTSEPFAPVPSMSESEFREHLDDRIAAALDSLEAPYREVLMLSAAGGLTYREIAEVLDCPLGTVMSRIARARRSLRERLASFARPPKATRAQPS